VYPTSPFPPIEVSQCLAASQVPAVEIETLKIWNISCICSAVLETALTDISNSPLRKWHFLFFIYNLNQQSEFTFYKLMLWLLQCLDGESSSGESPVPQIRSIGQCLLSRLFSSLTSSEGSDMQIKFHYFNIELLNRAYNRGLAPLALEAEWSAPYSFATTFNSAGGGGEWGGWRTFPSSARNRNKVIHSIA
jgi:hypothetical protein